MKSMLTIGVLAVACATAALGQPSVWWESFQHPGLSAAIEQGLSAHPDTESAMARIRAAEAGVTLARSGRRPEASVQAGYRWGREQSMRTGGEEDEIDPLFGAARLSWELDLFGKTGAGIDAATARAGQSEADLVSVRLLLALEIARAYVELSRVNEQAHWSRQEVQNSQAIYERAQRRAEAGLDPDTMRDSALAAWRQSERVLAQTEVDRDQVRARLTSLVGDMSPVEEPDVLSAFSLPAQPDLAQKEQLLKRPDVVKAHLVWLEARGEASASSLSRLPSLSLVVSAAGDGEDAGDPESWSAWAGPVVSLPVWNPGLKARAGKARAREAAAEAEWRAVSLRAVEEIDRAWSARTRSEDMIDHMQIRHNALTSVADTATRKRNAGLIQEDEVRGARLEAARAARVQLDWRAAALHAHLNLIAALGG